VVGLLEANAEQRGLGRRALERVGGEIVVGPGRAACARVAGRDQFEQRVVLVHLAASFRSFRGFDRRQVGDR
jgi:hypothetical protein